MDDGASRRLSRAIARSLPTDRVHSIDAARSGRSSHQDGVQCNRRPSRAAALAGHERRGRWPHLLIAHDSVPPFCATARAGGRADTRSRSAAMPVAVGASEGAQLEVLPTISAGRSPAIGGLPSEPHDPVVVRCEAVPLRSRLPRRPADCRIVRRVVVCRALRRSGDELAGLDDSERRSADVPVELWTSASSSTSAKAPGASGVS